MTSDLTPQGHELLAQGVTRPAFALAYLDRCGLGEIVVRHAGRFVERRYFSLADLSGMAAANVQTIPLRCPGCNRQGCDGSLAACPARWL